MRRVVLALAAALVVFSPRAGAQPTSKKPDEAMAPALSGKVSPAGGSEPSDQPLPAKNAAAPANKRIPDHYKLNLLIRTTVIAVNQANQTGNYTVLRDLAAPGFRVANSAEKLAEVFAGLRNTKYDLSPIMFYQPKLIREPSLMENGMLRLTGYFDTRPQRVNFDLAFEDSGGDWLLYGVSIGTKLAPAVNAQAGAPASPAGAAPPASASNAVSPKNP